MMWLTKRWGSSSLNMRSSFNEYLEIEENMY